MPAINPAHRLPNVVDPATNTVVVDLECRRCGYNLRTQHEQGVCPECGSPVGLSTRGNFLQYANPEWVAKVAKGLQIVFWMIIVGIAIQIGLVFLGFAARAIAPIIAVVITVVEVVGVWLMTEPDPSGIGEEKNVSARRIVRTTTVFAAVVVCGGNIIPQLGWFTAATLGSMVVVLTTAARLSQVVAYVVRYSYFAIIARRIPNKDLANRSRMLQKATIIFIAVLIVAVVIAELAGNALGFGIILFLPIGIGWIIFGIMTIFLIYRLQVAVTNEANAARVNWAADTYQAPPPMPPTAPPPTDD